jgi:serine/threonine-protein phosphatase 5
VIGRKVFVVHGGIGYHGDQKLTIDFIRTIDHTEFTMPDMDSTVMQDMIWNDMLWSDPQEEPGQEESKRGSGVKFGPDITNKFMKQNPGIELIVRSHELPAHQRGFQNFHNGKLITVFSASNYCGTSGNKGLS